MERRPKILLIDDDVDFVEATKTVLEKEPYEIMVAYDGDEGVKKAREEKPDLILLDVIMPVEDGFTAAEHLKKDAALGQIPVVIPGLNDRYDGVPVIVAAFGRRPLDEVYQRF